MVTTRDRTTTDDASPAETGAPSERRPVVTVRSSRPVRHPWWQHLRSMMVLHPDVRRRVLALLLVVGIVVWARAEQLADMPAQEDPAILLHATSHAIAMMPAANFDLVRAARPRFGLQSDGSQYNGIGIDTAFTEILLNGTSGVSESIRLLSSLVVTPGCVLRIEHYVGTHIRLTVEQGPGQSCRMRAEFIRRDDAYDAVERVIDVTSAASLTFRPHYPLHLRDVAVTRMGFQTNESGEWKSAIVSARLEIGDDADTAVADLGNTLTLGDLNGRIVELLVDDTMRVVFRGTATQPIVAGVNMRPSRLAELAADEDLRRTLAIVLGVIGLLAGFFQAVLR